MELTFVITEEIPVAELTAAELTVTLNALCPAQLLTHHTSSMTVIHHYVPDVCIGPWAMGRT